MMKLALCLEQTLGHRAHTRNLEQATCGMDGADVVRVEYRERGRLPLPWTVRGSADACRVLRQRPPADITFFHTQSIGLFAGLATRGRKYAISIDATPVQMDAMGKSYSHQRQAAIVEAAKRSLYRRVLQQASLVVAWSAWARESLICDYGVSANHIEVIHPGASPAFFQISRSIPARRPTILFVGGDFERKGGPLLLEAWAALRDRADLVLVTSAQVDSAPGIRVVRDATPGSKALIDAYANADIFCLPTLGDCTSVAVEEAMAAGLPVVTTDVGSNRSTVSDGGSGLIVPPGSLEELGSALTELLDDPTLRRRMGGAARDAAGRDMNAETNAGRLLRLLESVA